MIYLVGHKSFFGAKLASVMECDNEGFVLVSKNSDDLSSIPKQLLRASPFIFKVSESGKTEVYNKGSWELVYNGIYFLNHVYRKVVKCDVIEGDYVPPELSDLSSICRPEGINLSRLLNQDLVSNLKRLPENAKLSVEPGSFIENWSSRSTLLSRLKELLVSAYVFTMPDNRFPSGLRLSQDDFEGKGDFGERCNVNACQAPGTAFFYNRPMRSYYCIHCALQIHEANPDSNIFPQLSAQRAKVLKRNVPIEVAKLEAGKEFEHGEV